MDKSALDIQIDFSNRSSDVEQVDRLCQHLIAKKNFSMLVYEDGGQLIAHGNGFDPNFEYPFLPVPELKPLISEFDRILVRTDGISFVVYCIKNGLRDERKTSVTLDKLREVGKGCLSYTGSVQGTKMPVNLFVVEAMPQGSFDNLSHLKPLKCMPGKQKVMVRAFSLNFSSGKVWTNAPLNGLFAGRIFFQKALASISKNERLEAPKTTLVKSQVGTPYLTYGFLAVFVGIFIAELIASQSFLSPSGATLVAFGGSSRSMILQEGEWYRLISAAFLHGGYSHLILNCIAFFFGGLVLEVLLGRAWLFAIFILSAVGGSLASLFLNSPETLSVGASGGIMGLVAASFMIAFRLPYGPEKSQIQMRTMYTLISALIPIYMNRDGANIDYAAHLGGAVAGFLVAFAIYKSWAKESPEPGLMGFARGLAVICGLVTIVAGAQAVSKQGVYQEQLNLAFQLIPQTDIDNVFKITDDKNEQTKRIEEFASAYPEDPRAYYFQALKKSEGNDFVSAADLLKTALSKADVLKRAFPNGQLEEEVRLFLARSLIEQSKAVEARAAILPICSRVEKKDGQWVTAEWLKIACSN